MPVNDCRGGNSFAGNAKKNRGDISGRAGDGIRSQEKCERGSGIHVIDKGKHQGESCGAPKAWQDSYPEPEKNSHEHEKERLLTLLGKGQDVHQASLERQKVLEHK